MAGASLNMGLISGVAKLVFGRPRFSGYDAESLDPGTYHHFKNLIIPTSRGTSEIDHLIVSKFGFFVLELKDHNGWIWGYESNPKWTAMYFGHRFEFQNPLQQNLGHVRALKELLGLPELVFHPAVVFRGEFEFKGRVPNGVLLHRYQSWVESKTTELMQESDVQRVLVTLTEKQKVGRSARRAHIDSVHERLSSKGVCPACGGKLLMRVARKGPMPGSAFLGCSNYPRCRFTRKMEPPVGWFSQLVKLLW